MSEQNELNLPNEADSPNPTPPADMHGVSPLDDVVSEVAPGEPIAASPIPKLIKTFLIGKPRDLQDQTIFHHVSLIAFLAWVGLGADGLSSSCYGPEEAFNALQEHAYLAVFLSAATIITVFVISACYSHIIEEFPSGGGGYLVASKLLGRPVGVVSGCALLVDYVLTITVSIAAAGDALFGLLGGHLHHLKLPFEGLAIVGLIVLNLRGIKESVKVLLPIFILFLIMHAIVIFGTITSHVSQIDEVATTVVNEVQKSVNDPNFGLWAMIALLLHAYSMGAGTYTGIEAVSNSMPVMREPRVATAKRTMIYMATSLAITAGGLMLAYLLLGIRHEHGKTMNTVLTEEFVTSLGFTTDGAGGIFVWTTILAEGALLIVAAQAGFIDGPRVLANMAHDSWMPHWFANLSERLTTHYGILLMGGAALIALLATEGSTTLLVIMYSINVFLTFSLSMLGMCRHWWRAPHSGLRVRRLALFGLGATMCMSILGLTTFEKFEVGGWVTIAVTSALIGVCFGINRHYRGIVLRLKKLDDTLASLSGSSQPVLTEPDPTEPTAVILVGGYSGLGVHTMLNAMRFAPGHFKNVVFVSAGVVDSGNFKGAGAVEELREHCTHALDKYVDLANRLGMPSRAYLTIGTDAVEELEHICCEVQRQFPKAIFFSGKLVFQKDTFMQRFLHNETAQSLQRRLQWSGIPMVILPTRVR
jgi:amino acid transporter